MQGSKCTVLCTKCCLVSTIETISKDAKKTHGKDFAEMIMVSFGRFLSGQDPHSFSPKELLDFISELKVRFVHEKPKVVEDGVVTLKKKILKWLFHATFSDQQLMVVAGIIRCENVISVDTKTKVYRIAEHITFATLDSLCLEQVAELTEL